jgi:hypothetical protein
MDKQGVMERLRAMYARIEAVAPTATSVFPVLGRDFDEWQATIHAAIVRLEAPQDAAGDGWVLVPREPTEKMVDAFHAGAGFGHYVPAVRGGLRSAIAAAPASDAGQGVES